MEQFEDKGYHASGGDGYCITCGHADYDHWRGDCLTCKLTRVLEKYVLEHGIDTSTLDKFK